MLKLSDEPTITVGQRVSEMPSGNGRWVLAVDADKVPVGWVDSESLRSDSVTDSDVNLSGTSASRGDPLRDLLNSALSSPSGRCVVTDESGALIGTATDHDIIDAIRRAKEARVAGGLGPRPEGRGERSDRGVVTA
jgi:osmoprotectant transport system ATP-binding protein